MEHKSISIIGAGVAGLSIGWRMAQAGYKVSIFEKKKTGYAASRAAAGMLAAVIEAEPGEDTLLPFALAAQKRWPVFAEEITRATGYDIGFRETGTLFLAPLEDDVGTLEQRYSFLKARGLPIEWCERAELHHKEPYLRPRVRRALFSPNDHQVDNRSLVAALLKACLQADVTIHEDAPIDEMVITNNRVTGLRCKGELLPTQHVILCAGAWSGVLKGLPPELAPPVFPMKGQMLALQMHPSMPLLKHVVWTPMIYMVPRADGRLIIGATMEDKGFDENMTAGGLLHLLRESWDVLPGIEELNVLESWAGFRPTSRDDAPILGPSGIEGLTYATGQHRHGILMTPLLADLVRDYIVKGDIPELAKPFLMKRFANA